MVPPGLTDAPTNADLWRKLRQFLFGPLAFILLQLCNETRSVSLLGPACLLGVKTKVLK